MRDRAWLGGDAEAVRRFAHGIDFDQRLAHANACAPGGQPPQYARERRERGKGSHLAERVAAGNALADLASSAKAPAVGRALRNRYPND